MKSLEDVIAYNKEKRGAATMPYFKQETLENSQKARKFGLQRNTKMR